MVRLERYEKFLKNFILKAQADKKELAKLKEEYNKLQKEYDDLCSSYDEP